MNSNKIHLTSLLLLSAFLTFCSYTQGKTIYVDSTATGTNSGTTWQNAYNYLQDALQDAYSTTSELVEIWVAQATYTPDQGDGITPGDRGESFGLANGVALYGGFPQNGSTWQNRDPNLYKTILSGDLAGNDTGLLTDISKTENSYHVLYALWNDSTAILDGFTIIAARADDEFPDDRGAGIFNYQGSPAISNCIFKDNYCDKYGGALFNDDSNSIFTNCSFINNYSEYGGAVYNYSGSPEFNNCQFSQNNAYYYGGACYNNNSNVTIKNALFSQNHADWHGGAGAICNVDSKTYLINSSCIQNSASADPMDPSHGYGGAIYDINGPLIAINCKFIENHSKYGAGICTNASDSFIANCIFVANSAMMGGGARIAGASPVFTNCTFTANKSTLAASGLYDHSSNSNLTLNNSIFWANNGSTQEDQFDSTSTTPPNIDYCHIQGWTGSWAGIGNTGSDPSFIDPNGTDGVIGTADDNLRLSAGSPCIDAGNNVLVPNDIADIDNDLNTAEPIPFDLNKFNRFIDEPCTTDTGSGTPPIVDIGAYEFLNSDIDNSGHVDFADFAKLAKNWMNTNCGNCQNCDLDCDSDVDLNDIKKICLYWLTGG